MSEEKQYAPSAKKLKKAKEEGRIPKSKLLNWGVGLITLIGVLETLVPSQPLVQLEIVTYSGTPSDMALNSLINCASILLRIVGFCGAASACTSLLQTRLALALKAVRFKPEAINPASGFMKLGKDLKSLPQFLFGLPILIIFVIGLGAYLTFNSGAALFSTQEALWWRSREIVFSSLWISASLVVVIGTAELFFSYKRFFREFGMTIEELKEEYKEDYGDPHTRSERKALYEELMLHGLEKRVKNSKVVIVQSRVAMRRA